MLECCSRLNDNYVIGGMKMAKLMRTDEERVQQFDPVTGELIAEANTVKHSAIYKDVDEDEFVKIYYDVYVASLGKNRSALYSD